MVETQVVEQKSPEEKAKDFLAQLTVIRKAADTLQTEIEKLVNKKLDPNSDVGRVVETLQRLQQTVQRDLTYLDFTVKQQGGFRTWAENLLGRKS